MGRSRTSFIVAVSLTVLLLLTLSVLVRPMYPLARGTSAEFWAVSTGVDPGGAPAGMDVGCIRGDGAYYSPASMDSRWIYWVPKSEVMRDFPAVLSELDKRSAADDKPAAGYQRWKKLPSGTQDPNSLILCLQDEQTASMAMNPKLSPGSLSFAVEGRNWMLAQLQKADHYWANFVFEFLYLSAVLWFLFWPFIYKRSTARRIVHLMASPILLLLPAWLGYCDVSVGGVPPAGGIVYPWMTFCLARFPAGYWPWDVAIQRTLPTLFDALNKNP